MDYLAGIRDECTLRETLAIDICIYRLHIGKTDVANPERT